ncbi:isoaspartyl peptidase/L-asparaginase family protein [Schaalia naturae]|uniref:Isoaspartyl peptidase/L-asparaginase family protein n=1 Tax=Schaalia naturae TaxID=635203 RepID=A0ABW2SMA1_9ACTO
MQVTRLGGEGNPVRIVVHAGAGGVPASYGPEEHRACLDALERAARAGQEVLDGGGAALDAVCAAVVVFEDFPLFNAGRGAALTTDLTAEMDACLIAGDGRAGAVTCARSIRNPILGARAVMERTPHALMVDPSDELLAQWGVERADAGYFLTPRRLEDARRDRARFGGPGGGHGTVGAVAVDAGGAVAAATSTGGLSHGKLPGRVSDTSLVGAGSFARDGVVAVSCTGYGEGFIRGVVAHDIWARLRYGGAGLEEAVTASISENLVPPLGDGGGIIAVRPDGEAVVAFSTAHLWRAWVDDGQVIVPEQ